jgi:hypothetical protein
MPIKALDRLGGFEGFGSRGVHQLSAIAAQDPGSQWMGIACEARPGARTLVDDRDEAARRLAIDELSNPPLNPTKPTGSPRNLEAQLDSRLRCIIEHR